MRANWIILACWISGGSLASAQATDNGIADEKTVSAKQIAETTATATATETLDQLNEAGFSKLHYLAMQNKPIEAAALISEGADVNVRQGTYHGTPLQYAANKGHTGVVKLLILSDADLDAKDSFGRTPLMWAAQAGQARVVKQLIDAGADVNAHTRTGWNPLMYARKAEDSVSEKLLLEAGAKAQPDPPEPPKVAHVATAPTATAHPMFSKPDPFLALAPDSKQQVDWKDVQPTEMKVDVDLSILAQQKDGIVALPITIHNRSDETIRVRLTKEWHGGEWPSTDLYASVSRAGVEKMANFVPVYLAGESDRDEPTQKIRPGKSKQVWLRMDWPGTGSVRAEPLMTERKGSRYLISVMMLFDVGDQKQYTVSKLTYVGSPELIEAADADSPSGNSGRPSEQEVVDRLRRFRGEIDYITIPPASLPVGYRLIPRLPAVVLPDVSATEDEYFKVASAFIESSAPERARVQAAIVTGFQAGDAKIGVYAIRCKSEADAQAMSRLGLISKGKLLLYVWADGADAVAVEQVRSYYADKAFR